MELLQRHWNPRESVQAIQNGSLKMERAILLVRGDPPDNLATLKRLLLDVFEIDNFSTTTHPLHYNFCTAADFALQGPTLVLLEATRVRRAHNVYTLLDSLHTQIKSAGATPGDWHSIVPLVVANAAWAYQSQETGITHTRPIKDGIQGIFRECALQRAAAALVDEGVSTITVRSTLENLRHGPTPTNVVFPDNY